MAGFYPAEYAGKNPPDFGWEVDRWLHDNKVKVVENIHHPCALAPMHSHEFKCIFNL